MVTQALTVGEIASQLGCPIHRVQYLIASRHIEPVKKAGRFRIFDEDVVERLRQEILRNGEKNNTN